MEPPRNEELDRLALRAADGDRGAEEEVARVVFRVARKLVRSAMNGDYRQNGQDVLGDALVESVRIIRNYDGRASLLAYLRRSLWLFVKRARRAYWSSIGGSMIPKNGPLELDGHPFFRQTNRIMDDHKPYTEDCAATIDGPELRRHLTSIIRKLSLTEQEILIRRYGLFGARRETQQEIAAMLELTRQRIGQIEQEALERLRAMTR